MGKISDKIVTAKAIEWLRNVGNKELNAAAIEELGRYQRLTSVYSAKYHTCLDLLREVAQQRVDGCITAMACLAQELILALGEEPMPKLYECRYCEDEVPYSETEFDYSLKIRICKKCVDELKTREKR